MKRLRNSLGDRIDQYHALLATDWEIDSLDAVIKLARAELESIRRSSPPPFEPKNGTLSAFVKHSIAPFRSFAPSFLPALPARVSVLANNSYLSLLGLESCRILLTTGAEEHGFFHDLQSLVYLNVADALLPLMTETARRQHRVILLHAMWWHCTLCWTASPAHQNYLLSVLFHELDQPELELSALTASFQLTRPDEHDFVAKAQAIWMTLLEQGHPERATRFLLDTYRAAPREALPELAEMLAESQVN